MRVAIGFAVCAMIACGASPPPIVTAPAPVAPLSCPDEMARIDAFCIDRWEASLVRMVAGGEEPHSPYDAVRGRVVHAVSRPGVVPQGYVSHVEATAACEGSKKRLCAESEWLRACKGPRATLFPYGAERKAGACNGESVVSPLGYMPPRQQFPNMENMNNPRLNQLPNTLAKTGEYAQCTNDFGVFDMVGNLHEWVREASFLGGYYRDTAMNGDGCNYTSAVALI